MLAIDRPPTLTEYRTPNLQRVYAVVPDRHAAELLRRATGAFARDWDTAHEELLPDAIRVAAAINAVLGARNAAHWAFQLRPDLRLNIGIDPHSADPLNGHGR